MTVHVKNPTISTAKGWGGPRPKKPHGRNNSIRAINPQEPRFTAADAVLYAFEILGGSATCKEIEDYVRANNHILNVPTRPKSVDPLGHGLFSANVGWCYHDWGFIDEIGVRLQGGRTVLVHQINAKGQQYLIDRLNGFVPPKQAKQLMGQLQLQLNQSPQQAPAKDYSKLIHKHNRKILRDMFAEAVAKSPGSVRHYVYFDRQNPEPYVSAEKKTGARIQLDDPRHPYNDVYEAVRLDALIERRRLFVEPDYDAGGGEDAIIVRIEDIPVVAAPEPPVDNPADSESVVHMAQTPLLAEMQVFPAADARAYRVLEAEMRKVGHSIFEGREADLRSYLDMAWIRAVECTRYRHTANLNGLRNVAVPVLMPIPMDIDNPQNPYHYAVSAILAHAKSCGWRPEITAVTGGFTIRFVA